MTVPGGQPSRAYRPGEELDAWRRTRPPAAPPDRAAIRRARRAIYRAPLTWALLLVLSVAIIGFLVTRSIAAEPEVPPGGAVESGPVVDVVRFGTSRVVSVDVGSRTVQAVAYPGAKVGHNAAVAFDEAGLPVRSTRFEGPQPAEQAAFMGCCVLLLMSLIGLTLTGIPALGPLLSLRRPLVASDLRLIATPAWAVGRTGRVPAAVVVGAVLGGAIGGALGGMVSSGSGAPARRRWAQCQTPIPATFAIMGHQEAATISRGTVWMPAGTKRPRAALSADGALIRLIPYRNR